MRNLAHAKGKGDVGTTSFDLSPFDIVWKAKLKERIAYIPFSNRGIPAEIRDKQRPRIKITLAKKFGA